MYLFNRKIFH